MAGFFLERNYVCGLLQLIARLLVLSSPVWNSKKSAGKLFFPSNYSKMMTPSTSPHNLGLIYLTVFTSFLLISPSTQSVSQTIKIGSDGGYTDIVIQINDEVPEDHCPEILQNLKVSFFTELRIISSDFPSVFISLWSVPRVIFS